MSLSKSQNIIFYIALTLAVFQFVQYLLNGSVVLVLLSGLVPFWLWSTRKKISVGEAVAGFEQVLSYAIIVYAALAGLIALMVFVFWLTYANLDPAILENALAENPAINDLSDDELVALDEVMENLPSLLPILWAYLGLQSFAYLYYGIGVVRTSSPN
ncbi:MAG: hypothetical protein L7U61_01740 [Flavobacteriaceae bacterium]|jgi:hypothetical protein|nr:hypothetical protein [Flavobacteriaceae bacterium]